MALLSVNEAEFEAQVIAAPLPVVVDFVADWCQPCKQQTPILEEISRELAGAIKFVQVDVDQNPRIAAAFRVQSIPQLFVVSGGQVAAHWDRGLADKATLMTWLKPFIPSGAQEFSIKDFASLLTAKQVLPVDVREPAAFGRYRIPGAINIPKDDFLKADFASRVPEFLPTDGRLRVLYGRTNDEGKELAEQLAKGGLEVGFLAGGFLHWEADGFDVERGF